MRHLIESTLDSLRAPVRVVDVVKSCQVVTYLCKPGENVRVSKVRRCAEDLAIALGVPGVSVVSVPERGAIGIEVPREDRAFVPWRQAAVQPEFTKARLAMSLPIPFGVDKQGRVVVEDLAEMPHLLIAGATGSGKSVAIHSLIKTLCDTQGRQSVRLLLIDPKKVELGMYAGRVNVIGVVSEMSSASVMLLQAINTMQDRYNELKELGLKSLGERPNLMPRIVIVIDELADLIMQTKYAEERLVRLAQLGRAAGIHLVAATQRPTVDVVTGLIKANFPARLAFRTSSKVDSRVILDQNGAEGLLGKGDGLLLVDGELTRIQGCY